MSAPKVMWLGHAGMRVEIEHEGKPYVIYIDTWLDNPKMPADFAKPPTDADLILVTHGHFDHSSSSHVILNASTKSDCKIVAIFEIGQYF